MKSIILTCSGIVAVFVVYFGYAWVSSWPPPPDPEDTPPTIEGKKLIDSMLSTKGWKFEERCSNRLVHVDSGVAVYSSGTVYEVGRGCDWGKQFDFTTGDQYWISKNWPDARRAVINAQMASVLKKL